MGNHMQVDELRSANPSQLKPCNHWTARAISSHLGSLCETLAHSFDQRFSLLLVTTCCGASHTLNSHPGGPLWVPHTVPWTAVPSMCRFGTNPLTDRHSAGTSFGILQNGAWRVLCVFRSSPFVRYVIAARGRSLRAERPLDRGRTYRRCFTVQSLNLKRKGRVLRLQGSATVHPTPSLCTSPLWLGAQQAYHCSLGLRVAL